MGAGEVQPRHPHRARREHELRRLLQARPGRGARRALHDRRPARDGRRRVRARRPAADLRARRRAAQRRGAAADDARLLAGRQARGGRPRGARLGARRRRAPGRRTGSPRASTRTSARSTSPRRPPRGRPTAGLRDAGAWERLGRLRLRLGPRGSARGAAAGHCAGRRRRGTGTDRAGAGARASAARCRGSRCVPGGACAARRTSMQVRTSRDGLPRSYRMFTARETISPIVTSETIDCSPITLFAIGRQRHRVGRRERGGVGQRHVQVVDELRSPVARLDAVI